MQTYFRAQRLKALRRAHHISQREMAHLLGLSSVEHIARLESGKRQPSRDTLLKLKYVFGVDEQEFASSLVAEIVDALWAATSQLRDLTLGKTDAKSKRKLELFDAILSRLSLRQHRGDTPLPL